MGELFLTIVTVTILALRMEGTNHRVPNDLVRSVMQIASNIQLLLLCSFGSMTNGARAEHQTVGIQSCTLVDPNVWEIREYVKCILQAAVAIALLAGLMAIVVRVARTMIYRRRRVLAIPAAVPAYFITPAVQKIPAPFPIIPAIPAAAGVPGDDIDDVLARSPFPTKYNSPLSWL